MADLELAEPQPFLILEHHATKRPEAVALSTFARDFTYQETYQYATAIAGLLRRRGVQPGDVIAVQLRNDLNLFFMEAVYHEAAIWCPYQGTVSETNPVGFNWLLGHAPSELFPLERTIIVDDDFMADAARVEHHDPLRQYAGFESVCRIGFSSGTTGSPLAIAGTVARQGRPPASWLEGWPFFSLIQGFSGSGGRTVTACIYYGATYICPGEPDENVTLAERNFVSTLQGSPVQLAEFVELVQRRENQATSIDVVQFIGSYLSEHLLTKIRTVLGASVTACYGASEVGMVALRHDVVDNPLDVGTPLPGIDIEIVDEQDRSVPAHSRGIVRLRSSRRTASYYLSADAASNAIRGGWFYPGDYGEITTEGHLVLGGRISEVINAGGVKFDPAIVDGFLTTQPGVRDGAIVPYVSPEGLSGYAVVVVVDDEFELSTLVEPVRGACGGVAAVAIFRIDAIQRNQNGKVLRSALVDRVAALLAQTPS
jgi:long-chain acyl-CoA synthetase